MLIQVKYYENSMPHILHKANKPIVCRVMNNYKEEITILISNISLKHHESFYISRCQTFQLNKYTSDVKPNKFCKMKDEIQREIECINNP